jgi:hypothetical protein
VTWGEPIEKYQPQHQDPISLSPLQQSAFVCSNRKPPAAIHGRHKGFKSSVSGTMSEGFIAVNNGFGIVPQLQ